jgi:hypothetical protein
VKGEDNTSSTPQWLRPVTTLITTIIGAGLGLIIGLIIVTRGLGAGLVVLVLTLLGAAAGKLYAASEDII